MAEKALALEYGKLRGFPGLVCVLRSMDTARKIKAVIPLFCEVFDVFSEEDLKKYIKGLSAKIGSLKSVIDFKKKDLGFLKKHIDATALIPLSSLDLADISIFRRAIYTTLYKSKAGEKLTYSELAQRSGYKKAARAVGTAMSKNPLPIIIPCHRVISKSGVEKFSISCLKLKPSACRIKDVNSCARKMKNIYE